MLLPGNLDLHEICEELPKQTFFSNLTPKLGSCFSYLWRRDCANARLFFLCQLISTFCKELKSLSQYRNPK